MPSKKETTTEAVTFQAVCTKGDFHGPRRDNQDAAEIDAERHNEKPGKQNHIVNIKTIITRLEIAKVSK